MLPTVGLSIRQNSGRSKDFTNGDEHVHLYDKSTEFLVAALTVFSLLCARIDTISYCNKYGAFE